MTAIPPHADASDHVLRMRDALLRAPVETVPLRALKVAASPRSVREHPDHVAAPAEHGHGLPPLVVHRPTLRVIDGVHRLRAAALQGRTTVTVRFFDGSEEDAGLLAVALNVTHGLPLSMTERITAAERVLARHPHWSDRSVAAVTGLSRAKAAQIRRRVAGPPARDTKRVGRDGRARPVDPAQGRERAAALLRENPGASLRSIARRAGVSPTTVAAVRDRIARDAEYASSGQAHSALPRAPERESEAPPTPTGVAVADARTLHHLLRRDPSLRFTEAGRTLLRLLDAGSTVSHDRDRLAAGMPPHCRSVVAQLAALYAGDWQLFAEEVRSSDPVPYT